MPKFLPSLALFALAVFCSGCSNLEFPGVYKLTIEQGNIVTQEMVNELKPGMSRDQVEFVMGTPLIKDPFHTDRWDYLYSIERGSEPREQYRLSIFFEADRLKYFTGDIAPTTVRGTGNGEGSGAGNGSGDASSDSEAPDTADNAT